MKRPLSFFCLALPLVFYNSLSDLLLFGASVLLHESGHLFALYISGAHPKGLFFSPAGMELLARSLSYKREVRVHLAGPLFSLIGALGALIFARHYFTERALFFLFCNLFLGVLNLLPVLGLDGGNAFLAHLLQKSDPAKAYAFCRRLSGVFLSLLFCFGAWVLLVSGGNVSLLILAFLLVSELFGKKRKTV